MSRYSPPELLAARHQIAGFRCRSEEQTAWLVEMGKQAHGTGTTRVFVVTEIDQPTVLAYYAWCMASVGIKELPERPRRGAGRYPQPVALLARLGVDERHEGHGLGAALLLDVISRVASLGDAIGCRCLLVHAASEQARSFYEHLIPEFERSPSDLLHLLLLLEDIRRTLHRIRIQGHHAAVGEEAAARQRQALPKDANEKTRMARKLRSKKGSRIYAQRKAIVEPVNGQIKEGRGLRRFLLRGLEKVDAEWHLIAATHNLLKLFRYKRSQQQELMATG